jgi:drug/metabolite transporter (DMT)-like permease
VKPEWTGGPMVRIARDSAMTSFAIAVLLALGANVLFPLQDALTKQMITTLPVWAVLFVRSAAVLVMTLAIGRAPLVQHVFVTPWKGFLAIRAVVMLCGWMAFYLAVRSLGLGQAITLYFLSPILVALAAKPFLRERTPWPQWAAILLGFVGVALASGISEFQVSTAVALALLSACFWAVSLLMLRNASKEEGVLTQVAFCNAIFVAVTLIPAVVNGFPATPASIAWMAVIGLVGGAGQFCLYDAARRLAAPVLAALEYTSILSAFALGYLMFGETPTARIWLGAALILTSGLIVVMVEHGHAKSAGGTGLRQAAR